MKLKTIPSLNWKGSIGVLSLSMLIFSGCNSSEAPSQNQTPTNGSSQSTRNNLESLTVALVGKLQSPDGAALTTKKMQGQLKARRDLLLELLKTNPAEVLRYLIPASMRKNLDSSVQDYLEDEVSVLEGTIEHLEAINTPRFLREPKNL